MLCITVPPFYANCSRALWCYYFPSIRSASKSFVFRRKSCEETHPKTEWKLCITEDNTEVSCYEKRTMKNAYAPLLSRKSTRHTIHGVHDLLEINLNICASTKWSFSRCCVHVDLYSTRYCTTSFYFWFFESTDMTITLINVVWKVSNILASLINFDNFLVVEVLGVRCFGRIILC